MFVSGSETIKKKLATKNPVDSKLFREMEVHSKNLLF